MSFPRSTSLVLAVVSLFCFQFASPRVSRADTYQIVPLAIDNRQFVGMDDAGHVVMEYDSFCQNHCYEIFQNGAFLASTTDLPSYVWDYSKIPVNSSATPYTVTDNGWTATLSLHPNDYNVQDLSVAWGNNAPQLLVTASGFAGVLAINGLGDIIFDNGLQDEWYEALNVNTVPTPEPSSLLLLATGVAGAGLLRGRRRATT
jgi:hypothetical protein